VECIKKLSLILVKPLDLDIENGVIVDLDTLGSEKILFQNLLVGMFDSLNLMESFLVIYKFSQFFKLRRIQLVAAADPRCDPVGQKMVAVKEPPPEGDAVGLVVELLRVDLIELAELILL